jgi:hypothetical protein
MSFTSAFGVFAVSIENKAFSRIAGIGISQQVGKTSFLNQYSV